MDGIIAAVRLGGAARLPGAGRRGAGLNTAYFKSPASGPVAVLALGLAGDVQVNRRYHGGLEKAVYGYPVSGYTAWQAEFPDLAERLVPGAMGENLVIEGQDEANMCIGDVLRCGTATLQISQIREPCSTFAAVLGTRRVVRAMTRSGRCGWYYRVLEEGMIAAGASHDVIDRPNPTWTVARLAAIATGRSGTAEALRELSTLPGLAPDWHNRARTMLATQAA